MDNLKPALRYLNGDSVALHTGHNFWKEYLLRFLKTPPFKNLKMVDRYFSPGSKKTPESSMRVKVVNNNYPGGIFLIAITTLK